MKPLKLTPAVPAHLLVLIGGGEFSFGETREVDEFLLSKLPEYNRRVAFVPTASGSSEYATHFGAYLKTIAPDVEVINVPVYRGRDGRRQKNIDVLTTSGLIYLGGGVSNNLLDCLRGSPADMAMRDAASRGAIVAAIGGAASSFGTHVRDMRTNGSSIEGLGWLEHTVVETQFHGDDDTMLRRLMSTPDTELGIGIPTGLAVAIGPTGETELVGKGSLAVFRKG